MMIPGRASKPNSVTLELCFEDCPNVITAIRRLPEAIQKFVVTAHCEPPMPPMPPMGDMGYGPLAGYAGVQRRRPAPSHLQVVDEGPEPEPEPSGG